MGKAALVVTLVGFVGLVVGLIGTIAFLASDEFVKATLYCESESDPNCDADANTVVDAKGEVCQIGNLGLFVSSYTPGCAEGTTYELSDQVPPISDAPTTEFGILFPGQTNFAGIVEDNGFPEFTDCEEYFGSAAFTAGLANFTATTDAARLEPFRAGLKAQFDAGIDDIIATVDGIIQNFGAGVELLLASQTAPLNVSDLSATFFLQPNWVDGMNNAVLPTLTAPEQAVLQPIVDLIDNLQAFGCTSTAACLDLATYAGTPDWGTSGANVGSSSEIGIGPKGLHSRYNTGFCGLAGCTYEEFLAGPVLSAATDPADIAQLNLVLGSINNYFLSGQQFFSTAAPIADKNALTTALDDIASPPGLNYNQFFSRAAFITNTKASLLQENAIPNSLTTEAQLVSPGFGLLCPTRGIGADCSFVDLINQLVVLDGLNPVDNATTAGLLTIQTIVTSCGAIDFDVCFANIVQTGLISGLYDVDAGASLATMIKNATDQCEDDEADIAAIAQAQQLMPVGAGLNGAGLAIAVLALVLYALGKNPKIAKVVILVGAVISIIGLALAIVALLGVIGAPIYQSLGGDDLEEGDQVFANSVGYEYILAGVIGNALGAIILLAGGLCLPTAESDALAAK